MSKIYDSAISRMENPPTLANDLVVEIAPLLTLTEPDRVVRPPSRRAVATAQKILQQLGQPLPLLVDDGGAVIVGLEFLKAAQELGWSSLKIVRLHDVSAAEKRALTIALHRLPELSVWDEVALANELGELLTFNTDFDIGDFTGFTVGEMDVILDPEPEEQKNDPLDALPDATALPSVSQQGDIWRLGPHRLLCGSAVDAANIILLMVGNTAAMVLTDPPYNIAIKDNVSPTHANFAMGVGEQSRSEFTDFLRIPLFHLKPNLVDGALVFVFMDRRHLLELQMAGEAAGFTLFDLAIWNKGTGGMGSFYRSQFEPCMIFKHGTASHRNNIELGKHGRYRTNVWGHRGLSSFGKGRTETLAGHPTVKPVALLAEAVKDCTKKGDIIVDLFMGSGSTLLAAEKTGRVAYGMELEPKYVDLAIRRWQTMTGQQAVLEATGENFAEVTDKRTVQSPTPAAPSDPTVH